MNAEPGTTFGPYEIVHSLGGGGMGDVYRARDLRLGRDLAIKFLRADLAENRLQLHRFEREARAASALNHPSIITIYEIGEHDGHPYIAMEYVEGRRLRDLLAEGRVPVERGLEIAVALAEALAAAHGRGIVHRDLKPENVMITPEGRIKILDFGLAKPMETSPSPIDSNAATLPGVVIGTAGYMAPEQAKGLAADFRSDQFALGTMLYEIFGGRSPFRRGTTMETISAILRDTPRSLTEANPEVPDELAAVIERCLEKDPAGRYASTSDLAHDVRQIQKRLTSGTHPAVALPRPRRRIGRRGPLLLGVGLLLILAAFLWVARPVPDGAATPRTAARLGQDQSLLIVPFREMSTDPEWQLIAAGISETVAARLGLIPSLQVISPSAISSTVDRTDVQALARRFGATLALTAILSRSGDRVRVTYSVMNPGTGVQLFGGMLVGATSDLWGLEDQIATRVAEALEMDAQATGRAEADLLSPESQDRFMIAAGALQRYDDPAMIDRAIELLEPLARTNPRSALVHSTLGRAYQAKYLTTKDPEWGNRAISTSRKASRLNPEIAEVHVTLGKTFLLTGNPEEAVRELTRALEMRPDDPDALLTLAAAYEKTAPERAEATYQRAIALRPAYWAGYNGLGVYYFTNGRYDEALAMFTKVSELTPDNSRGLTNVGAAFFGQGRFDEAIEAFRRATQAEPSNPAAFTNLATGYYYDGRLSEARSAFQKAVSLAPNSARHRFNLADTLHALGQDAEERAAYEEAIRLARLELRVNPTAVGTHQQLILAYSRTGEMRRAQSHLEEALALAPEDSGIMWYGALMYFENGDHAKGIAWLERAIAAGADPALLAREPALRPFRNHPRVARLLADAAPARGSEGRTQ